VKRGENYLFLLLQVPEKETPKEKEEKEKK
jgi:hypothetical protein